MAYMQGKDGSFRLRASFPMDKKLILKANAACEKHNLTMFRLCYEAVSLRCDQLLAEAVTADRSGLPDGISTEFQ
jgi:hypothetical protein